MNKDNDIFYNGVGIWGTILSLSGLINIGVISILKGFNLTLSGQIATSRIICYCNTSISGSVYMNKDNDIFHNGVGIWGTILTLSDLIKAGI